LLAESKPETKEFVARAFIAMLSDKELHPKVSDWIHCTLQNWKHNAGKVVGMLLNEQLPPKLRDQIKEVFKDYTYKIPYTDIRGW